MKFAQIAMVQKLIKMHQCANKALEKNIAPILKLCIRLIMVCIFVMSGMNKLADWEATLFLFENEYQVPFLPTSLAAFMATITEVCVPIILLFGFMSRICSLILIMLTLVIHYIYPHYGEHYYWLLLLGTITCYGPGKYSLDYYFGANWIEKNCAE